MFITQTQLGYKIEIPSSFHDYTIIDNISNGCYSSVVLVRKESTNELFSAKIISFKDMEDKKQNGTILNEINALISIDHPNIVKFYETFEIQNEYGENFCIIIEEYCSNGCLLNYILNNEIKTESQKKKIAHDLIDAINYLHEKGIAHCDIKPENILLDTNFSIRLCDFGFAKDITKKYDESKCGTENYLAPELLTVGKIDFFKSDIWAAGITLYTIFKGEFPFNNLYEASCGMLSIEINDKKLKNLIVKCTQFNPQDRPYASDLLNEDYFTNYKEEIDDYSSNISEEIINS